jgi:hypothetical protein
VSAAARTLDEKEESIEMDNPDGTGALTISRMTIEADSVSFDFEGKVEGYGTVFATHTFSYIGEDRSRGRVQGEARTFLDDGGLVSTPHMGTFTRDGSKVSSYFTDATNHGVVNFVIWDIDILSKAVSVRYWEVKSP